ncbi:hypothetical protein [Pseudorhodoplanes sp.]|uniref:hypothetical protein n=1 Tax=Pseudorhodoplanes sp. TaxID=1934341 RepID=UPI002B8E0CB2|nr:hypothetical protein [Pseudorhodoplanes sp.]HWV44153.1 hypothetical protein [Pseudorhodoplanes sp.]
MSERPIEELVAGEKVRAELIKRADSWNHDAPMFYGWVIMEAFLAGIDYARNVPKRR